MYKEFRKTATVSCSRAGRSLSMALSYVGVHERDSRASWGKDKLEFCAYFAISQNRCYKPFYFNSEYLIFLFKLYFFNKS